MLRTRKITLDTDTQTRYLAVALTVEPPNRKNTMSNLLRLSDGSFAPYTEPGGYPVYYVCDYRGWIYFACADCASKVENGFYDVRIVKANINWEDDLCCEYCGRPIECAYV